MPEPDQHPPTPQMLAANKGFGVSTENLDFTLAAYSEEHAGIIRWWIDTAKDQHWSLAELARRTGVSTTTLSRINRGVYGADISTVIERLRSAKELFGEAVENPDFIPTALARRMFAIFDKTRALRNVTILWGPMGIGKTTIEEEYTRQNNHGRTYYFRCPGYGPTLYQFVCELASTMRISVTCSSIQMREKIGAYLARGNRLLIVDELHEVFRTCKPRDVVRICEWLRQLYDCHHMGLALTGTKLLEHEFFRGRYAEVLAQLVDRGTIQISLPAKPTKKDILAFLSHYKLPFPQPGTTEAALLDDILAAHGLRKLTLHLRDGAAYASRAGEAYTWHHFTAAFQSISGLFK